MLAHIPTDTLAEELTRRGYSDSAERVVVLTDLLQDVVDAIESHDQQRASDVFYRIKEALA